MQSQELRAARQESEELLHRYEELFLFAPIGYFQLDKRGIVQKLNFEGARLLGQARGILVGRVFKSFVSERDQWAFDVFLATLFEKQSEHESASTAEFVITRAPAGAAHVHVTASPFGQPFPFALLAVEDVTQRRIAEDALREESHRRDEFLATLSHELRNPLAPIRNAIYLLQRLPPGDEKAKNALAVLDRQATHLTRIVEDLLDVTRIVRGRIRLEREIVDLGVQALRTVEDHRSAFQLEGVGLECLVQEGPYFVMADASRIAQVLGNLLGNALKFTNRGGKVVVLVRHEGATVALAVRDSGVGMAPEVLSRLFEPFSQAPQTLDRSRGGLGLGLAMVKGLVDLHGGTVDVTSEGPGRGTEFTIRLPASPQPEARHSIPDSSAEPPPRILIIEDNRDAAQSLKEVLELKGHKVKVAFDGPSGIDAAHAFLPEVIICDIGLPVMSGYEVARAIRGDAALHSVRLVAMSGYAAPDDLQKAHEAGFDKHVAKPPRLDTLFSEVAPPMIEQRPG